MAAGGDAAEMQGGEGQGSLANGGMDDGMTEI